MEIRFGGKPHFFETMAFGDKDTSEDLYCRRYSTYEEAVKGHNEVVCLLKTGKNLLEED